MKISNFLNLFKSESVGSSNENSSVGRSASFRQLNSPFVNKTAMSFVDSQLADKTGANSDPTVYQVIVSVPKDKSELTYDQLEKAVIKTVLQKNGVDPSVAAVEQLAERRELDFTPKYDWDKKISVSNPKDSLMADVNDKKNNRYIVDISASLEKSIVGDIELAKEITASGEKAFSELTMEERLQMVFDRAGKDLPQDAREALKLIDPKMLIGGMAIGAGFGALAEKGLIASEAFVLVGGAVTMAQLLSYMGEAEHILDQVKQATKPVRFGRSGESNG